MPNFFFNVRAWEMKEAIESFLSFISTNHFGLLHLSRPAKKMSLIITLFFLSRRHLLKLTTLSQGDCIKDRDERINTACGDDGVTMLFWEIFYKLTDENHVVRKRDFSYILYSLHLISPFVRCMNA